MSNELEALRARVFENLSKGSIDLFSADHGIIRFDFAQATNAITDRLIDFIRANGRAPELMFNDGMPPSWAASLDRDRSGIQALVTFYVSSYVESFYAAGEYRHETRTTGVPIFLCKLLAKPGATFTYIKTQYLESGDLQFEETLQLNGAYNGRVFDAFTPPIPLDKFQAGAFQTWGLLMLAARFPHTVYATDEGFLITPEGVAILERTCAVHGWAAMAEVAYMQPIDSALTATIGRGPYLDGIPVPIAEYLRKLRQQSKDANSIKGLLSVALTFAGFAFGGAAASGLLGGAVTFKNIAGTLSLANKFGADTGAAGSILKIADALTGGANLLDTFTQSGSTPAEVGSMWDEWDSDYWSGGWDMPDWDYQLDWGLDDFAAEGWNVDEWGSFGDFSDAVTQWDAGSYTDWTQWDTGEDWGFNIDTDWDTFNDSVFTTDYDYWFGDVASNVGPVSLEQFAKVVGVAPQVATTAAQLTRSSGANPASTSMQAQQAVRASQQAQQQKQAIQQTGIPGLDSVFAGASNLLNLYAQYQQVATQVAKQKASVSTTTYPQQPGQVVRQPDGSMTMMRDDGSLVTIRPDGSIVNTKAGFNLPNFLAQNKTALIIGGAALAGLAVLAIATRDK